MQGIEGGPVIQPAFKGIDVVDHAPGAEALAFTIGKFNFIEGGQEQVLVRPFFRKLAEGFFNDLNKVVFAGRIRIFGDDPKGNL